MENKTTQEMIEEVQDTMHYYRTCTMIDQGTNEEVTGWEVAQNGENPIVVRELTLDEALKKFYIQTR